MTALVLVAALAAATPLGQGHITDGQIETHAVTQSLEREIAAATARGGARWIGYRIRIAGGHRSLDCLDRTRIALEPASEISILARYEGSTITRLRTATPDCEIDAGGLPVTWLENVKVDDGAAWLAGIINADTGSGERFNRVTKPAITALGMHEGTAASRALVAIARTHPMSNTRNDAIFWLSQRAGDQLAAAAIVDAIERDPDTDVKKRAVFALSQLPKDESIPKLIDVAKSNKNAAVRQQAMFWLGQSNDPRALKFFEDVLLK